MGAGKTRTAPWEQKHIESLQFHSLALLLTKVIYIYILDFD